MLLSSFLNKIYAESVAFGREQRVRRGMEKNTVWGMLHCPLKTKSFWLQVRPWQNDQTLLGKHFQFANQGKRLTVWAHCKTLLVENLLLDTNISVFEVFQNHCWANSLVKQCFLMLQNGQTLLVKQISNVWLTMFVWLFGQGLSMNISLTFNSGFFSLLHSDKKLL